MKVSKTIRTVFIQNRIDCCSERLSNFFIHVGDDPDVESNPSCSGDTPLSGGGFFDCNLKGKYLGVRIAGR